MQLAFVPVLAAPLILAATNMVMAESQLLPDRDACWERIYDDAHLNAHPRQQVVQIRLFHLPSRWPQPASGVIFVALEMNLRARTHGSDTFDYSLGGFCQPSPGGLRCKPEWRAGSWQIERGANGSLIVRNDDITVNPSSSAAEERSEGAVTLKAADDEAAWRCNGCPDHAIMTRAHRPQQLRQSISLEPMHVDFRRDLTQRLTRRDDVSCPASNPTYVRE